MTCELLKIAQTWTPGATRQSGAIIGDHRGNGLAAAKIDRDLGVGAAVARSSTTPAILLRAEMRGSSPLCASMTEDALTKATTDRPGTSPSSAMLALVMTEVISISGETLSLTSTLTGAG